MGNDARIDKSYTTDIRIVGEDDLHIIVNIRVDKAWLARNLDFIAALFDFTSLIEPET